MSLKHILAVIVGFKVGVGNSVFYKKLDTPSDSDLGCIINKALHDKEADFISIRRVEKP